jgi:hypothetical protein
VAHAPVPVTEPVGVPLTVTTTVKSSSHTVIGVLPSFDTLPTKALLVFVEVVGPLTITSNAPSTTGVGMIVTVTADVLLVRLPSLALNWNVKSPLPGEHLGDLHDR